MAKGKWQKAGTPEEADQTTLQGRRSSYIGTHFLVFIGS
jgi:hypothetical protein